MKETSFTTFDENCIVIKQVESVNESTVTLSVVTKEKGTVSIELDQQDVETLSYALGMFT